jgi:hypothetical protein
MTFLDAKWAEQEPNRIAKDDDVDPDGFAVWGFGSCCITASALWAIARNYGYKVRMEDVPSVRSEEDFLTLVSRAIGRK